MEAQPMGRTLDFADIGSALLVSACLCWLLQLAAGRAVNRSRKVAPCRAPSAHRFCGIGISQAFCMRKYVPIILWLVSEEQFGPLPRFEDHGPCTTVQRNDPLPGVCLGCVAPHRDCALHEIHGPPAQSSR